MLFVHRFRFDGISNQIQAAEMYQHLRRSMKLEALYRDVKEELDAAVQFAMGNEQNNLGRSSYRLTIIAAIVAAIGLAFAFLSTRPNR